MKASADALADLVSLEEDAEGCRLVLEVGEANLGADYEVVWVALIKRFRAAGRTKFPIGGLREYAQAIANHEPEWGRALLP